MKYAVNKLVNQNDVFPFPAPSSILIMYCYQMRCRYYTLKCLMFMDMPHVLKQKVFWNTLLRAKKYELGCK